MIRVAIETSTRTGSVAVGREDRVLARVELGAQTRHAARALPALDEALRSADVGRLNVGAVVVGAGPGSFTGVRVAGATAKGLATALEVPLLAYSSLLALVTTVAVGDGGPAGSEGVHEDAAVCGLFDARRGEVYAGCWRVGPATLEELVSPMVGGVAAVVDAVRGSGAGTKGGVAFVGEGVAAYGEALEAACFEAGLEARLTAPDARPAASALLWLAHYHPSVGAVDDPASWEPRYVRGSSAERGVRG